MSIWAMVYYTVRIYILVSASSLQFVFNLSSMFWNYLHFQISGYYPYNPYSPLNYTNGQFAAPLGAQPPPGFLGAPGGGPVPTGKLVDLSSTNPTPILHHLNGNGVLPKRNGIHNLEEPSNNGHASSASSTSTLTGQPGPIPLTIKTLEAESKRKTLLAEAAAAAASANEAKNPLESWDYVYRWENFIFSSTFKAVLRYF